MIIETELTRKSMNIIHSVLTRFLSRYRDSSANNKDRFIIEDIYINIFYFLSHLTHE